MEDSGAEDSAAEPPVEVVETVQDIQVEETVKAESDTPAVEVVEGDAVQAEEAETQDDVQASEESVAFVDDDAVSEAVDEAVVVEDIDENEE